MRARAGEAKGFSFRVVTAKRRAQGAQHRVRGNQTAIL